KPAAVRGHKLVFRDAAPDDAAFILSLRTDEKKGRYLSATPPDMAAQRAWLERYAGDDTQIYFIIENLAGEPVGTVRLYDRRGDSFCWGSWIKSDSAPSGFAVESALMVYHYALYLGFTGAHFEVRRGNTGVIQFHERFGARLVRQDEHEDFFELDEPGIRAALDKFARFLPDGIKVDPASAVARPGLL
ncbi:MAG TPA: GNAT family N-acetyltransferase, partial [Duganella sp.]|nr:GNAT family N-acetyltransferase [Duganella sp.]